MRTINSYCIAILVSLIAIHISPEQEFLSVEPSCQADDLPRRYSAIDLSGFRSSASHWRNIRDESRFIKVEPNQSTYEPHQVNKIVANILLFQRTNGGWPKDYDMTAILSEEQRAIVESTRRREDTSYDNGNLHSQVAYLAHAYSQNPNPEWRAACERGIDFILASQYPHGGFPQRFPNAKSFHAHITFNDGVMMGILDLLWDMAEPAPQFAWLDASRRDRARTAIELGIDCILKCQIRAGNKPAGWCQQHDEQSFEARPARTFELASNCPQETSDIVKFLQTQVQLGTNTPKAGRVPIKFDTAAVQASIAAALEWLDAVKLTGIRVETIKAPREEFLRHTADFDRIVVSDPKAPPLWARHYEIGTDRPIFAGRDGIKKYALAEIERERRTGTLWYGRWPASLLAPK